MSGTFRTSSSIAALKLNDDIKALETYIATLVQHKNTRTHVDQDALKQAVATLSKLKQIKENDIDHETSEFTTIERRLKDEAAMSKQRRDHDQKQQHDGYIRRQRAFSHRTKTFNKAHAMLFETEKAAIVALRESRQLKIEQIKKAKEGDNDRDVIKQIYRTNIHTPVHNQDDFDWESFARNLQEKNYTMHNRKSNREAVEIPRRIEEQNLYEETKEQTREFENQFPGVIPRNITERIMENARIKEEERTANGRTYMEEV